MSKPDRIEAEQSELFRQLGGEEGCLKLSKVFYGRVATDTVLKPLFPGKSFRCATEEFSAFLVQFFGGDESRSQYRWWLGLRDSHARFQITEEQRSAWILHMKESLREAIPNGQTRDALTDFFLNASHYLMGAEAPMPKDPEMAALWSRQLMLEDIVRQLNIGSDAEATKNANDFRNRKGVFVGILATMMTAGRRCLIEYATVSIDNDPDLRNHFFNGRTLLHFAASAGCLAVVMKLLNVGTDPNVLDAGGHTPLYRSASCLSLGAEDVVRELIKAGAEVNHGGGTSRSTALHQAARYGNIAVAKALLASGADLLARDKRLLTPYDRAVNCRRKEVAALLAGRE